MSDTAASHLFCNQASKLLKKIGHEPSGGQNVKSQEKRVFIMLSGWISSSYWIRLVWSQ